MSDRGSNLVKALEGQDVLFCFGHRLNNVLQRAFYQTGKKREGNDRISTFPTSSERSSRTAESSDEDVETEDEEVAKKKPSPSKQPEATIVYANLPEKPKEVIETIVSAKSIVKYVKLVSRSSCSPRFLRIFVLLDWSQS